MINYDKAKNAFDSYVENYDAENKSVRLKIGHTYNVVALSEQIAKDLKLDNENVELAKVIALLHDIGRFEQITVTKSFEDGKFDHADYGAKVLIENKLIEKFVDDEKYYDVIYKAVLNHNKYKIEDSLSDYELLHCKIIRDSDKLDNFNLKKRWNFDTVFSGIHQSQDLEKDEISDGIYNAFMQGKLANVNDRRTKLDFWLTILAFIFDLNFDFSLRYVKENDYINAIIDKIEIKNPETKKRMEDIRNYSNNYLAKF